MPEECAPRHSKLGRSQTNPRRWYPASCSCEESKPIQNQPGGLSLGEEFGHPAPGCGAGVVSLGLAGAERFISGRVADARVERRRAARAGVDDGSHSHPDYFDSPVRWRRFLCWRSISLLWRRPEPCVGRPAHCPPVATLTAFAAPPARDEGAAASKDREVQVVDQDRLVSRRIG